MEELSGHDNLYSQYPLCVGNLKEFLQKHGIGYSGYEIICYELGTLNGKSDSEIREAIQLYSTETNLLHLACSRCSMKLVQLCLDIGININDCYQDGHGCLIG